MLVISLLTLLHLLAAVIWVGGMFFAWMILRPAVGASLEAPQRLQLWNAVFPRFFVWVWLAVLLLPITGMGMWHMSFHGFEHAPRHVHMMAGIYLAMLALYLRISLLLLPRFQAAVHAQTWPVAGEVLAKIRRLVGINLLLGLAVIAIAVLRVSV